MSQLMLGFASTNPKNRDEVDDLKARSTKRTNERGNDGIY